jgi:nucleoside-diphosphate-sugar epimerase
MKHLLILGGTYFIGRNFVEYMLSNHGDDYSITICNRNKTRPLLFDNFVKKITLDRKIEHTYKINDRKYDAIIDFSGFIKDDVKNIIKAFSFEKYIFLSSSMVEGIRELEKMKKSSPPDASYMLGKFEAENFIKLNAKNYSIIRSCFVVGKDDYTDRFKKISDNYYIWKNSGQQLTYYIKSEDLAEIIYQELDKKENRIFNPCKNI